MALTNKETLDLILKLRLNISKTENEKIIETLLNDNIDLIKDAASKVKSSYLSYDELIQESYLAFLNALNVFDLSRKISFKDFLKTYLVNKIKKADDEALSISSIPEDMTKKLNNLIDAEKALFKKLKRYPSDIEVIEYLKIKKEEHEELKNLASSILKVEIKKDDCISLYIESDDIKDESLDDDLDTLLLSFEILNDKEKKILSHYYGVFGKKKMSIDEISNLYNVSHERIRQIINLSLKKLRRQMED